LINNKGLFKIINTENLKGEHYGKQASTNNWRKWTRWFIFGGVFTNKKLLGIWTNKEKKFGEKYCSKIVKIYYQALCFLNFY